jgi:hypothetical protein
MGNLLYGFALILLLVWAVTFFGYNAGGLIHVLLVVAVISVLLRIIAGKKII